LVKYVIALLVLSCSASACAYLPPLVKVRHRFVVHVKDEHGPIVGLKLRLTQYRPPLSETLIAESQTDGDGNAAFAVKDNGDFDIQPEHPARHLSWIVVHVGTKGNKVVELTWPSDPILETTRLRGRIVDGLGSRRSSPLVHTPLSLRQFISYYEVAATTTHKDGSFDFGNVPGGLYFIRVNNEESDGRIGNVAVYIGPIAHRERLNIATEMSDCGLMYDLEENKKRYAPQACFNAAGQVPCDY
jgi:hypothetical protein